MKQTPETQTIEAPVSELRVTTMQDIAQELGLTKATVSYALNGKGRLSSATRQAVLETAQKMDFRPNPHAQRLTNGRCYDTVGLFTFNLDLGVTTRKLQLLQKLLAERGYRAPIHVCGGGLSVPDAQFQAEAMNNLRLQRPLAIICNTLGLHSEALQELRHYIAEGGVAVCYDVPVDVECDQILFDREHNTHAATRHLLELGHRRIAFHGGWETPNPLRLAGYRRALDEFGVEMQPEWLLRGEHTSGRHEEQGGYDEENGARLVDLFLGLSSRPTAACITDDAVAAAFVAELGRRRVRVPDDVSVIGQDDLPLAAYLSAVPLSTVSQPVEAIADQVVHMLAERLAGHAPAAGRRKTLYGELIRRQSTAPIPN